MTQNVVTIFRCFRFAGELWLPRGNDVLLYAYLQLAAIKNQFGVEERGVNCTPGKIALKLSVSFVCTEHPARRTAFISLRAPSPPRALPS